MTSSNLNLFNWIRPTSPAIVGSRTTTIATTIATDIATATTTTDIAIKHW